MTDLPEISSGQEIPEGDDAGTSSEREVLRDQIARKIRDQVGLRYGPNATEILQRGGSVHLTSGEADTAADAALAAIEDAGYQLWRPITEEEEAEDARLWG